MRRVVWSYGFLWAVSTMTSNGNGNTPPTNLSEAWVCSFVIMAGQLLFVVLTGAGALYQA